MDEPHPHMQVTFPFDSNIRYLPLVYLTQENEGLKEKVNSEKSIQKQMEVLTLKKDNERLRRFVDSIPPEVRRILREQQRQQRPKDHDL